MAPDLSLAGSFPSDAVPARQGRLRTVLRPKQGEQP